MWSILRAFIDRNNVVIEINIAWQLKQSSVWELFKVWNWQWPCSFESSFVCMLQNDKKNSWIYNFSKSICMEVNVMGLPILPMLHPQYTHQTCEKRPKNGLSDHTSLTKTHCRAQKIAPPLLLLVQWEGTVWEAVFLGTRCYALLWRSYREILCQVMFGKLRCIIL